MTGQSGLNKSKYLAKTEEIFTEEDIKFDFITVGHKMIENYYGKIDERTILNLPKPELELLHALTWKEILKDLNNSKEKDGFFVLNTHSVFRWHHGLFPTLDIDLVLKFKPDMVICLIDDVLDVKKGLQSRGTDIFNFWELFAWREEETWISKFIAASVAKLLKKDIPFFLLPKAQGPRTLVNLLSKPRSPKAYISFPITGISPEEAEIIGEFKSKVKESLIVFDPYRIKDRRLTVAYYTAEEEIKEEISQIIETLEKHERAETLWESYVDELTPLTLTRFDFSGVKLLGRELLSVIETIDSQIISRDHMLIDQSDFVIMYIKEERGSSKISAGCQSEMIYAYTNGKPVYVIFSGGAKKLSPWVTQFSAVFKDVKDCLDHIQKTHINKERSEI